MIWQEWFITWRGRILEIWNEIIQLRYLAYFAGIDLYLRERWNIEITGQQMIWIIIGSIISLIIVAWFWDKTHLISHKTEFNNRRNPMFKKQTEALISIDRKLGQLLENRRFK